MSAVIQCYFFIRLSSEKLGAQQTLLDFSANLSAGGISGGSPFLFLVSSMTVEAMFSGIVSQWSNVDCQNACPAVADRIFAVRLKVSATGI